MKILVVIVMLLIVGALISGLLFLVRDKGQSNRVIKALSWRIGLSVVLFLFLFLGCMLHWITPHGL